MPPDIALDARTWLWCANACYLAGFIYGTAKLARRRSHSRIVMLALMGAGFVVQTVALYLRGVERGSCPITNGFEMFQFTAWSAVLVYLVIGTAFRMNLLGFLTSGLACAVGLSSLFLATDAAPTMQYISPAVQAHAGLAMLAYGFFATLALGSGMHLLQSHALRHRRFEGLFRKLPSIVETDRMNLRLLVVGCTLLAAAMAFIARQYHADPSAISMTKLLLGSSVLVAYLTLLGLRLANKLVSRAFALCCIAVFLLALAAIVPIGSGMSVHGQGTHSR